MSTTSTTSQRSVNKWQWRPCHDQGIQSVLQSVTSNPQYLISHTTNLYGHPNRDDGSSYNGRKREVDVRGRECTAVTARASLRRRAATGRRASGRRGRSIRGGEDLDVRELKVSRVEAGVVQVDHVLLVLYEPNKTEFLSTQQKMKKHHTHACVIGAVSRRTATCVVVGAAHLKRWAPRPVECHINPSIKKSSIRHSQLPAECDVYDELLRLEELRDVTGRRRPCRRRCTPI